MKTNTYAILNGEFDESKIKQSEVPFYNSIKCNPQPIETISQEIPSTDFIRYWATIEERKSSSPSGRHVEIFKALAKNLGDREMKEKQEYVLEYIRLVNNNNNNNI